MILNSLPFAEACYLSLLFVTTFCYFLSEFPIRQEFNIWLVTGNAIVCSLQGIGPEIQSPALSKSLLLHTILILERDQDLGPLACGDLSSEQDVALLVS